MTIMMIDWICITPLSLNPVAEFDITQRQREESNGDYDKYQVLHVRLLSLCPLPRPLFAAEPPDDPYSCRILVLGKDVLCTGEEDRHVRPIAPKFVLHLKPIGHSHVIGRSDLLQRLGDPAKQATAIGKVLRARSNIGPGRELILGVSRSAGRVRRGRRLAWPVIGPQSLDYVVALQLQ